MPKLSYKLTNFSGGTVTTLHSESENIGEVSVFAENIEPITESGVLRGVPMHSAYTTSEDVQASKIISMDTPESLSKNSQDILWYDPSDGYIKVIQDFYSSIVSTSFNVETIGQISLGSYGHQTWAKRGSRLYIGLGGDKPTRFIQYFDKMQFGSEIVGYKVCGNELTPASMMSNIDILDIPNQDGADAWTAGGEYKYALSATAADRLFRYRETAVGGVEAEVSNIIGSGLKSITCSQVEDRVVWLLANDDEGHTKVIKVSVNDADFSQCNVVSTKQVIKGFTTPDGAKDVRTELNINYKGLALDSATQVNEIKGWILSASSDILAVKRNETTEDIYILSHWSDADNTDWLSFSSTGYTDTRGPSAREYIQFNDSESNSPFFSAHKFLHKRHESSGIDMSGIFYDINHPARILWSATNLEYNVNTTPSDQIANYIPTDQKVVRFYDKSPYWHYPKTGYQLAQTDPYINSAGGARDSWGYDSDPTSDNQAPVPQEGTTAWVDSYEDTPTRHGHSQFVFYDLMWLYKWTKLCPAGLNYTNKGAQAHDYTGAGAPLLWPSDTNIPSSSTAGYGFTSFTTRPWGYIDNGVGNSRTVSQHPTGGITYTPRNFWVDHIVKGNYVSGGSSTGTWYQYGHADYASDSQGLSNSTFGAGAEATWSNGFNQYIGGGHAGDDDVERHNVVNSLNANQAFQMWDSAGSILGRRFPFSCESDGSVNLPPSGSQAGARGPFDNTNVRFGARQFAGVYHSINNPYGVHGADLTAGAVFADSDDLATNGAYFAVGSGCGWTGLIDFQNWHLEVDTNSAPFFHNYTKTPTNIASEFDGGANSIARMQNSIGPRSWPKMFNMDKDLDANRAGHRTDCEGYSIGQMRSPKICFPEGSLQRIPGHEGYVGLLMGYRGTFVSIFSEGLRIYDSNGIADTETVGTNNPNVLPGSASFKYDWMAKSDGGIPGIVEWWTEAMGSQDSTAGNGGICTANVATAGQFPNDYSWYFPQRFGVGDQNHSRAMENTMDSPIGLCMFINRYDCSGVESASDVDSMDFDDTTTGATDGCKFPHIRKTPTVSGKNYDEWNVAFDNSPLGRLKAYLIGGETGTTVATNAVDATAPKNVCYNNTKKRMFLLVNNGFSPTGAGGIWGHTEQDWNQATMGSALDGYGFFAKDFKWKSDAEMADLNVSPNSYKYYISSPLSIGSPRCTSGLNDGRFDTDGLVEQFDTGGVALADTTASDDWTNHKVGRSISASGQVTASDSGLVARELISKDGAYYQMGGVMANTAGAPFKYPVGNVGAGLQDFDPIYIKTVRTMASSTAGHSYATIDTAGSLLLGYQQGINGGYVFNAFHMADFAGDSQGGTLSGGRHVPWGVFPVASHSYLQNVTPAGNNFWQDTANKCRVSKVKQTADLRREGSAGGTTETESKWESLAQTESRIVEGSTHSDDSFGNLDFRVVEGTGDFSLGKIVLKGMTDADTGTASSDSYSPSTVYVPSSAATVDWGTNGGGSLDNGPFTSGAGGGGFTIHHPFLATNVDMVSSGKMNRMFKNSAAASTFSNSLGTDFKVKGAALIPNSAVSSTVSLKEPNIFMTITGRRGRDYAPGEAPSDLIHDMWKTDRKYRFKVSLMYDGYQESPLTRVYFELNLFDGTYDWVDYNIGLTSGSDVIDYVDGTYTDQTIFVGAHVSGIGIPNGAKILSIDADNNQATMTANATITTTTAEVTFSDPGNDNPFGTGLSKREYSELDFEVLLYSGAKADLNPRVTGLNVYCSYNDPDLDNVWSEYRLLYEMDATDTLGTTVLIPETVEPGQTQSEYFRMTFTSAAEFGSTYQILNGISETLLTTYVTYGISAHINDLLFVSQADVPRESETLGIADEDYPRHIFVSNTQVPGNWSQFNWGIDSIVMPEKIVALHAYNGRIWAFSHSNMYRINPTNRQIEHIYNNVGCKNANSVTSTANGMFWMDYNNIYLMEGMNYNPIGHTIKVDTRFNKGLKTLLYNAFESWATYDSQAESFIAVLTNTDRWAYNMIARRWDRLNDTTLSGILDSTQGLRDDKIIVPGVSEDKIYRYQSHNSLLSDYQYKTAEITMNNTLQEKVFKKVKVKCLINEHAVVKSNIEGLIPGEYWKWGTVNWEKNDAEWAWKQTINYMDEEVSATTGQILTEEVDFSSASHNLENDHSGNIGIYVDGIHIVPTKIENEVWRNTQIDGGHSVQILEFFLPPSTKGRAISIHVGDPMDRDPLVYNVPSRETGMDGNIKIESMEIIYRTKPVK